MWQNSRITKVLKIKIPIIQAPMAGGITTPELVANISNAGGLGSFGAGYLSPGDIRKSIHQIRLLTNKPFAVNLFIPEKNNASNKQIQTMMKILKRLSSKVIQEIQPIKKPYIFPFEEQIRVVIDEKVPVFSFTFGVPSAAWINKLKRNNIKLIGTVTNISEALLLESKGIDMIVAQGSEAGGHRGTFIGEAEDSLIGNFALIPQIIDRVKIPVIAAGGIMDARGIVAAMILGASGVQMGTAFISCREAGAHSTYKKILLKNTEDHTTLTRSFSGKLARGIQNHFIQEMKPYKDKILPYPIQHAITKQIRDASAKKGNTDYMSLWAGQASSLSRDANVGKLIHWLDKNVRLILRKKFK